MAPTSSPGFVMAGAGALVGGGGTDGATIVGADGVLEASTTMGSGASEHAVSATPSTPPSTVRTMFTQTTLVTAGRPRAAAGAADERQFSLKFVKTDNHATDRPLVTDAQTRANSDGPRRRKAFATAILSTLTVIAASVGFGGPERVQAVADTVEQA